jgi:hypothetical protein
MIQPTVKPKKQEEVIHIREHQVRPEPCEALDSSGSCAVALRIRVHSRWHPLEFETLPPPLPFGFSAAGVSGYDAGDV